MSYAKACLQEGCTFIALHSGECYFCMRKTVRKMGVMWVEDVLQVSGEYITLIDHLPLGMRDGDVLYQNGSPFDLIASVWVRGGNALILVPSVKYHGTKPHPEVGRTLSP